MNDVKLSQRLFSAYYNRLVRFLTYRTKNRADAEEIASDVLYKVITHYDEYDSAISKEFTWICDISNKTLIDYYRKNATVKGLAIKRSFSTDDVNEADNSVVFQVPDKGIKADSLFDQGIVQVNIESALNDLKPAYKALAVDFFQNELSYGELVEKYELPLNNVKVSLNRIRTKLQGKLENDYQLLCV